MKAKKEQRISMTNKSQGQALVEFALSAGILTLLLAGSLSFANVMWKANMLQAATQQGARIGAETTDLSNLEAVRLAAETRAQNVVSPGINWPDANILAFWDSNEALTPGGMNFFQDMTADCSTWCYKILMRDSNKITFLNVTASYQIPLFLNMAPLTLRAQSSTYTQSNQGLRTDLCMYSINNPPGEKYQYQSISPERDPFGYYTPESCMHMVQPIR